MTAYRPLICLVWLVLLCCAGQAVSAQEALRPDRQQKEQELKELETEKERSQRHEMQLRSDIEALVNDRKALAKALLETAQEVRDTERKVNELEHRLGKADFEEKALKTSLEARQDVIADLLVAMQRLGRKPPPAVLVHPDAALEQVRSAILLGALLPDVRQKAQALIVDLKRLADLRRDIEKDRTLLGKDLTMLAGKREELSALVEERQRQQRDTESAAEQEKQKIQTLARQSDTLRELVARLEKETVGAKQAADAAARSVPSQKKQDQLAMLHDPSRLSPAIAFHDAKGMLPLPVNGVRLREFGAADASGVTEKGVSIATRPRAQVTAPCDGWVVYAGPFRSYGHVLILNAGGGYHVMLAGLEVIDVSVGQFVLTGEPIGGMGQEVQAAATFAQGATQPILYVEFRKDGVTIDPAPWWTDGQGKVRG